MKYEFSLAFLVGLLVGNLLFSNYEPLFTSGMTQLVLAGICLLVAFRLLQSFPNYPEITLFSPKRYRKAVM